MDVAAGMSAIVQSAWLLPVLVLVVAVDAPFPILPSETLLMTAVAVAFSDGDVATVAALFVAAVPAVRSPSDPLRVTASPSLRRQGLGREGETDRPVSAEAPRSADTGHHIQRVPDRGVSVQFRSPSKGRSPSVTGRSTVVRSTVSAERPAASDGRGPGAALPHVGEIR